MNLPTILIGTLVAVVFLVIIIREVRNRKKGKGSCSCGCSDCGMSDICHGDKK